MAQDLVELDEIGGPLLEPVREPLVQLGPHRLREGVIRGVPDQEMPEAKGVVPRQQRPSGPDQLPADERGEPRADMCFLGVERLHGTAVEDLAFHRAPLQHPPLGAGELVEPGLEKCPQGRGHVHLAALRRHREHLRQEERIAAGRLCHPAAELWRKLVADQHVHLVRGQRLEPQRDRPLAASREQVGPTRAEEQDRPARRE